jgi:Domain of unknown function (DUF4352)
MTDKIGGWIRGKPTLWLAIFGLVALLVGCGGGSDDETTTVVTTTTTTAADTAATEPDATEPEASAEPAEPAVPLCRELRKDRSEGPCFEPGEGRFVVANRNSTLKLPELTARIVDIETTDVLADVGVERPNGVFLIFTLEITNRLSEPLYFDEFQEQVTYTAAGTRAAQNTYTEDFNAANGGDMRSFLWQGEEIQPDTSQTGTVIFDVPQKAIEDLDRFANLRILNFSDAGRANPRLPVGVFRTYAE